MRLAEPAQTTLDGLPTAAASGHAPAVEVMRRLTFDIPEALHRRIRIYCAENDQRMADVIRDLLEERFPAW
ncbi:conserved hypothetical protein (plasmid) [Methylobacterium nodulans ORS 2060]|uniref:Plasmid segregation centromere-binding protein ParG n=1 Tax=Methylobacterium nodulans (strain LMG 21967 / CNCM I-2342 / ORS 2060) TaxID=460265 RepID=B8IVV3_METNO|nr:conserved hypothetical protein [Methylobacterium nodulans ORS 2060]